MYIKEMTAVTLLLLLSVVVQARPVPIGTVASCRAAAIHGTNLVPGTTIFSGETIDVGVQGNVWIAVQGGGQVQVSQNSTVLLTKGPDSIRVTVDRGKAQTNGKGIVIRRVSSEDGRFQEDARVDHDKHNDRDCEVRKNSRKIRPCRDDID